jgi:hypothetical protein
MQASSGPPDTEPLTSAEASDLQIYENIIRSKLTAFINVGQTLKFIRDRKLYRQGYGTFEEYCLKRWQLRKSHTFRLIAEVEVNRSLSPIGDKMPRPENEAQFRELIGLTPEQVVKAWASALKAAGNEPVTAAIVRQAAAEFRTVKKAAQKPLNSCIDIVPIGGGKLGRVEDAEPNVVSVRSIRLAYRKSVIETRADLAAYLAAIKKAYAGVLKKRKCIAL